MRLTVCADDYALSPAVTQGILEAVAAGRLNAVGAMTNRPYWPESARLFEPYANRCQLGLHLNFTCGAPLSHMAALAPDGRLPDARRLMMFRGKAEIQAEIMAQIDAFRAHYDRPPQFIDGHQHVHVLPNVRGELFAALEAQGLRGKLWLRDPSDRLSRILRRGFNIRKALLVALLARGFGAQARALGYVTNDGFSGFSSFDGENYPREFAASLRAMGSDHLLMCHPGHIDDELRHVDRVVESREVELAFLLGEGPVGMLGSVKKVTVASA